MTLNQFDSNSYEISVANKSDEFHLKTIWKCDFIPANNRDE